MKRSVLQRIVGLDEQNKVLPDAVIGRVLFLVGFFALLLTEKNVGFVRDESVYFHAAESYARWYQLLFRSTSVALTDNAIVQGWDFNHEHPALMKTLFGWSYLLFHDGLHWLRPAAALRLPSFVVCALALPVLYTMGRAIFGRTAGVFAALCWLLVPRQFFDAHLACFDMPVAAMWLFVVYGFWRAQSAPRWWLYTGLIYGLSIATKHNALFIPFVLAPFALYAAFADTRNHAPARTTLWQILALYVALAVGFALLFVFLGAEGFQKRMEPLSPHAVLYLGFLVGNVVLLRKLRAQGSLIAFRNAGAMAAIAFLGPLLFYATWPYLWHHPVERTAWYLAFHAQHNHYTWFYMGKLLREPPFPLDYVVVLTALTVPLTLFLPMVIGWLSVLVRIPLSFVKSFEVKAPSWDHWLLLVNGAVSIVLISLPDVPHFGGTKHWYPSMPFLGILAGAVVCRSATVLSDRLTAFRPTLPRWVGGALLCTLLALPALVDTARIYAFGTSSYSELAGGLPGAATLGMQRQFWSNNVTGVLPWLNQHAPPGSRIWMHEVNGFSFRDYQRNGMLSDQFRAAGGPNDADFAVYQYHQEFREQEYAIWNALGLQKPETGLYLDETPQIIVYRRR